MNAIRILMPYRYAGQWVFDDEAVGLVTGFRLLFSPTPFPGYTIRLEWARAEYGGNWYKAPQLGMEGWLCPALFRYFKDAPEELYGRVEARG